MKKFYLLIIFSALLISGFFSSSANASVHASKCKGGASCIKVEITWPQSDYMSLYTKTCVKLRLAGTNKYFKRKTPCLNYIEGNRYIKHIFAVPKKYLKKNRKYYIYVHFRYGWYRYWDYVGGKS